MNSLFTNEEYLNTFCRMNITSVRLPFKDNHPLIHDNFELCKRLLLNLHQKLIGNPDLLKTYNEIFIEQNGMKEEVMSPGKLREAHYQKQPFRGALKKRCSENMQQIYRRTPMPKCDFKNVALQLY